MISQNSKKTLWYILYFANWAIILFYWWQSSGGFFDQGIWSSVIALGRLAGLGATYTILIQFFFMGRLPYLERIFGLDKLAIIHQKCGKWGYLLLLSHPLLLTIGYSRTSDTGLWSQLWQFITTYEEVVWAVAAFILFSIIVGTSLVIIRKKLRYETWYSVHIFVYISIFLSLLHQLELGPTVIGIKIFHYYWIALYIVVFTNQLLFRFLRPAYFFNRHQFRITRIERETHDVISIHIGGRDMEHFKILPGQFMILRFLQRGFWWQSHPFSLSMVPNGQEIRVSIKAVGDFTKKIPSLTVDTKVFIDGPYGIFTRKSITQDKLLFIAGGIGITPIRSLLEESLSQGYDCVLLYGNKTSNDIVFGDEFRGLLEKYKFSITHIMSGEPGFSSEKGYLDEEKLRRLVPDFSFREVFLCGPPVMMNTTITTLLKIGIPHNRIHFEKFSLP
jgi:predicted ferric reductase